LSYFDSPPFTEVQKIMYPQLMHNSCGCLCKLSSVTSCANANSIHCHQRMGVSSQHTAVDILWLVLCMRCWKTEHLYQVVYS